jgi:hypothetical protein
MSGYKMNMPVKAFPTIWYRMLRAIYKANKPLHKKEWFTLARVHFSDSVSVVHKDFKYLQVLLGEPKTRYSYRHWKGLYPDMFKAFQWRNLVKYDSKERKWNINKRNYESFCSTLNVKP